VRAAAKEEEVEDGEEGEDDATAGEETERTKDGWAAAVFAVWAGRLWSRVGEVCSCWLVAGDRGGGSSETPPGGVAGGVTGSKSGESHGTSEAEDSNEGKGDDSGEGGAGGGAVGLSSLVVSVFAFSREASVGLWRGCGVG